MKDLRNDKIDLSILYVEDELITRMTIHKILAARYATIYLAQDGREGLEIFEQHNPDIIITDTRMPVMDGLKMSQAIRAVNLQVPIIFTTANEDSDFIEATMKTRDHPEHHQTNSAQGPSCHCRRSRQQKSSENRNKHPGIFHTKVTPRITAGTPPVHSAKVVSP